MRDSSDDLLSPTCSWVMLSLLLDPSEDFLQDLEVNDLI